MRQVLERKQLDFIDGLRGVAVLWVIFHHGFYFLRMWQEALLVSESYKGSALEMPVALLQNVFFLLSSRGFFGVDIFFVISGFLITGLLISFLSNNLDIRRFYLRRFFKIIPHYYFVTFIVFVFLVFSGADFLSFWKQLLPHPIFLQNYYQGIRWLDHTWSLVVEEQFYIFWSFFLFILSRFLRNENDRWVAAISGAFLLIVLISLNRFFLYSHGSSFSFVYPMTTDLTHGTSVTADGLMFGCVLRLAWFRYPGYFKDLKIAYACYILGFLVLGILLLLPLRDWGVPGSWYSSTLAYCLSVLFIMAGLGGASWLWQAPWLRQVGKSSYGIYLVHYPLLLWIAQWIPVGYVFFFSYVLSAALLGFLTTMKVEKYFLNMRERICQ